MSQLEQGTESGPCIRSPAGAPAHLLLRRGPNSSAESACRQESDWIRLSPGGSTTIRSV